MVKKLVYTNKELKNSILPLARKITNLYKKNKTVIIGIQGGQGTGKTTLSDFLKEDLQAAGYKVVTFSIDDFYETYRKRQQLRKKHKNNPFYTISRGLPGTHKVVLLSQTLKRIKAGKRFELPLFDKSLYQGAGNVLKRKVKIRERPDFVLFEGWCLGLPVVSSLSLQRISTKNNIDLKKLDPHKKYHPVVLRYTKSYQKLWKFLDYIIMLKPDSPELHQQWRWQQEEDLRYETGKGMTEQEIEKFVMPYLPFTYVCYEKLKPNILLMVGRSHDVYELLTKKQLK